MFKVDLTTLFGITPINTAPITAPNFKGDKIGTFNFELEGYRDNFVYNPLGVELKDPSKIKKIIEKNKTIQEIFKENNIKKYDINMTALSKLYTGHMSETRVLVAKIFSNLPIEMRQGIKGSDLQDAAMLHDYGKILIPKKILNKEGSLTPEEKKIMDLHSEFGYELLKAQGVRESLCKLVKYHHQKPDGSGYPTINEKDDFEYGIASQILTAADMYSALTEDRSYHTAYSTEEALNKIHEKVKEGIISQEVFDALKIASKELEEQKTSKQKSLQTTH